jgi:hypothetical protein
MKKAGNLCNLRKRPLRPAAGNGGVQQVARRLLDLRGMVTVREIIEYSYADRLLLRREQTKRWFYWAVRRALESIGAIRIRRLPTIGRPWLWALPQTPLSMLVEGDGSLIHRRRTLLPNSQNVDG